MRKVRLKTEKGPPIEREIPDFKTPPDVVILGDLAFRLFRQEGFVGTPVWIYHECAALHLDE